MMDGAAAFLHRKERKAIERKRRKEPFLALVPVYHGDRLGLLAATPSRLLFAARRGFGARVIQWRRKELAGARFEARRYGVLVLATKAGGRLRFELTSRDDKEALLGTLLPSRRQDPVKAATAQAKPVRRPARPPTEAPDPLAHLGTPAHEAKLRDMHRRGLISKQELEWQLGK